MFPDSKTWPYVIFTAFKLILIGIKLHKSYYILNG